MKECEINIKGEQLILSPLKAIFWPEKSALIFSDLHFGKAAHFRRNGVPIPHIVHREDLQNISYLLEKYSPETVIIVGDLFHSELNCEWDMFESFLDMCKGVEFILVRGNHDILDTGSYKYFLKCVDSYELNPFYFSHKPIATLGNLYNISGHLHPSITISGRGRLSLKLECFYFSDNFAVLPSFGNFTGNYKISAKFGDQIYLIVDDQVVAFDQSKFRM